MQLYLTMGFQTNVLHLKTYKQKLVVFPRRAGKFKAVVSTAEELANATQLQGPLLAIQQEKPVTELVKVTADMKKVNAYDKLHINLILADLRSKSMLYVTNRPKEGKKCITEVSPGIHVLTNDAMLDFAWPKSLALGNSFKEMLNKYGDDEASLNEMALQLMTDTTRDDKSLLPCIYSSELEYKRSSIFIDHFRHELGKYGTRSTDAMSVNTNGEVTIYERYIAWDWYEKTETFQIKQTTE
ncbi:uncharacterized protein LOC126803586 [Argentina anserina]|uniref:uncharacterized protein LOC126803586 n=1 Tax=Argentina anserina TaxID=57926 RepID=UPI002176807C|nr:uncharacterized protein LOC126803586 [Potentilla anserina]